MYLSLNVLHFKKYLILLTTKSILARVPETPSMYSYMYEYMCTRTVQIILVMSRDGGKWWSKDHHLLVIKILKNVDFSLKNVKKW